MHLPVNYSYAVERVARTENKNLFLWAHHDGQSEDLASRIRGVVWESDFTEASRLVRGIARPDHVSTFTLGANAVRLSRNISSVPTKRSEA